MSQRRTPKSNWKDKLVKAQELLFNNYNSELYFYNSRKAKQPAKNIVTTRIKNILQKWGINT